MAAVQSVVKYLLFIDASPQASLEKKPVEFTTYFSYSLARYSILTISALNLVEISGGIPC
jgi:hypothetical protein